MNTGNRSEEYRGLLLHHELRDLGEWSDMTERVADVIVTGVGDIKGPAAADELRRRGIEYLHQVIDWRDVAPLRDQVLERLRKPLLAMAVAVGRRFLGWQGDFFVDDYLILRVNFPYEVARRADSSTENPGTGRLSESVRAIFQARKTIDPVYNPKAYHQGHPPAAWAHGPHLDSWVGHSRDGRNIWWAIGDVPAEAGMVLYPELADKILPCDPQTLCLQAGYPLPKPTHLPLRAGEMLIFNPQVLHGTHLNTSEKTRVAITMRLDASKPTFDPSCFYAHEFWRKAVDIEQEHDEVLHLLREDNLGPALEAKAVTPRRALPVAAGALDPASGIVRCFPEGAALTSRRVIIEAEPHRVMLVRSKDGLRAYDAACPHYGLDLADGGDDDEKLYCPACAVGFDLQTGESACPSLTLRSHEVWEAAGAIHIRITP